MRISASESCKGGIWDAGDGFFISSGCWLHGCVCKDSLISTLTYIFLFVYFNNNREKLIAFKKYGTEDRIGLFKITNH